MKPTIVVFKIRRCATTTSITSSIIVLTLNKILFLVPAKHKELLQNLWEPDKVELLEPKASVTMSSLGA